MFAKFEYSTKFHIIKYNQVSKISWFGTKREKLSVSQATAAAAYISVTMTAFSSRKKKAVTVAAVFSFPAAVLDESFTEQLD